MKHYSIKLVLRTDKILKNGNSPICIQVIINSKKKRISTGESVNPKHWDKKNGLIIGKGYGLKNSLLNKQVSDMEEYFNQTLLSGGVVTFSLIDKYLNRNEDLDFFKILDKVILFLKDSNYSEDTIYKYVTLKKRLRLFKSNIFVSDLKLSLITSFDLFLKKINIGVGGEHNHHKCLKSAINIAIINDYLSLSENPYKRFKMPNLKHRSVFLEEDEVILFKNYNPQTENEKLVKDMFLLACFSGLRYSDLYSLKFKDIDWKNSVISKVMLKTKHSVDIPLNKLTKALLCKYILNKKDDDKIFPEIDNQVGNRLLKKIAKNCGINKNVSFHVGRHTFASFLVNSHNVSLPIVSKLLGHTRIANTMIYTNSNINSLKNVMNNIYFG